MEKISGMLAFIVALSMGTERIVEVIKGLSSWLSKERQDPKEEAHRKVLLHVIAIAVGSILAYLSRDQLGSAVGATVGGIPGCILFGAIASSGSGFWNSALDLTRDFSKEREKLAKRTI